MSWRIDYILVPLVRIAVEALVLLFNKSISLSSSLEIVEVCNSFSKSLSVILFLRAYLFLSFGGNFDIMKSRTYRSGKTGS